MQLLLFGLKFGNVNLTSSLFKSIANIIVMIKILRRVHMCSVHKTFANNRVHVLYLRLVGVNGCRLNIL